MTKAQWRALEWLPPDGSWTTQKDRSIASALHSLWLYHRVLVQTEYGNFGPRGGLTTRWRLTEAGVRAISGVSGGGRS